MHYVWVILLYSLCFGLALELEVGDMCQLSPMEMEVGICRNYRHCIYAQKLVRDGGMPGLCGFIGKEPIVCCPNDNTRTNKPAQLVSAVTPTPSTEVQAEPLSEKKCREYYPRPEEFHILVVGGQQSLPREFPHMALIGYGPLDQIEWRCGGSLISPKFVLTAAHCLNTRDLGGASWVHLGDLDLSTDTDDASPQDRTVIRRIPHPSYKPPQRYHDIALLELDRDINMTLYVAPACLPTQKEITETRMTATGWGNTEFMGSSSTFLMKLDLDYVPFEQCVKSFGSYPPDVLPRGIQDEVQICAGGVIGEDTCQGDSGGPIQVPNRPRSFLYKVHTIIGITSLGKPCALSAAPALYTRVSNYVPWIESIVWADENI